MMFVRTFFLTKVAIEDRDVYFVACMFEVSTRFVWVRGFQFFAVSGTTNSH